MADATVRPSMRTIEGPRERVTLEPKVMQVLLAFCDARGAVITRDDLIRECWGGRIVGDDAVNRTIAELRRVARESGASVAIETIPRIGYRLDLAPASRALRDEEAVGATGAAPTRRTVAVALVAGLAVAGGLTFWRERATQEPLSETLVDKGRRALHNGFPDSGTVASQHLRAALQRSPRDAEAWGLLAYAYRDIAESASPENVSAAIEASEEAARRALELDPQQGDALAARATVEPYFGDFAAGEDRLMKVLAVDPENFLAVVHLVGLLQGVGRVRSSAEWNDRAYRIDPHSPVPQYRRALKLWSMGQLDAADQAIDRAMLVWPRHPSVWNARMMLFAYTGRPAAALTLLDDKRIGPTTLQKPALDLWRTSLRALESRSAPEVEAARLANVTAASRSPGFANNALMTLSMLGELDAAFEVADGYFLRRGPLISTLWEGAGELPVSALRWRRSMALFVPPAAPMRADPRFDALMDGMGLTEYWRQRNVRPDYRLSEA
ncbi:MAG TPA: winged helix-turn-helix domain-containing protein [Qipengyuania sp.]|nr:winged helix-turn-helix domain-containing protein [Qipengyuania sp.]